MHIDKQIDFIVHVVSQTSPQYYGTDLIGTLNANILGTHYLFQFVRGNKIEFFLMFSFGGVYDQVAPEDLPMTEHRTGFLDCLKANE